MPAVTPPPIDATAAEFAAMDPNVEPVGQRVCVSDDGEKEYEARGGEGNRVWVLLHGGHVDDHEASDVADVHTSGSSLAGEVLTSNGDGTAGWASGGGGSAFEQTVDTDDDGVFAVTIGTNWGVDADGLPYWQATPTIEQPQAAKFALDSDALPYLELL